MDAIALRNRGQRFAGSAALDRFDSLVVAQLARAAELDAGGLREKWLDKASTVRFSMSGERRNTPQTAR
jgi:hypothetical protein